MARIEAELFDARWCSGRGAEPPGVRRQPRQLYQRRRESLRTNIANLTTMANLAQQELAMNTPLLETGDVSRSEILRLQRAVADLRGQIDLQRNEYLRELQAEYTATEASSRPPSSS
jgi:adhesin transport system membrane fusion protein